MRYECTYGPELVKPSTMSKLRDDKPEDARPSHPAKCGCGYYFKVYQYKHDPTLAFIERPLRPHFAHPSGECRWISRGGREALREAHAHGVKGCGKLRDAMIQSIATRIGKGEDHILTDADRDLILKTRPDLARDENVTSQDVLYVGPAPVACGCYPFVTLYTAT